MNRSIPSVVAATLGCCVALGSAPAFAQYANEFTPAKVVKQGTTTKEIAGSGTVEVQVQVNADGTHKVTKVLRTTNPADNAAAMDIAQNSSYKPAMRGTTPQTSFYDFTLKFNGKSVSGNDTNSPAAQIERMIRAGNYSGAKTQATSYLQSSPTDDQVRQLLGVADFYSGDTDGAAAAFAQVNSVDPQFRSLAAQSLANAAVKASQTDPAQSLTYAQKAVSLDGSTNSKFALGVAQIANKQYADAATTLKAVHQTLWADPKTTKTIKVNVDQRLLEAYLAQNDTADAQAISDEMKQLDPSATANSSRVMGNHYLQLGVDASKAKEHDQAIKYFEQAAATGDPQVEVTAYAQAAFESASVDKPDWSKVKGYADKALAIKPDDAAANFAEGIALTGQYATNQKSDTKAQAVDYLNKADNYAKAEGNQALAQQIESFMKTNIH